MTDKEAARPSTATNTTADWSPPPTNWLPALHAAMGLRSQHGALSSGILGHINLDKNTLRVEFFARAFRVFAEIAPDGAIISQQAFKTVDGGTPVDWDTSRYGPSVWVSGKNAASGDSMLFRPWAEALTAARGDAPSPRYDDVDVYVDPLDNV